MSAIVVARDIAYEFANGRELFRNLTFSLTAARTALVGPNGVGKTCLARLLAGEIEPTHGSLRRHAPIRRFAQHRNPEPISVTEFLGAQAQWSLTRERLLQEIDREASCSSLSGGQWMRVRLARALDDRCLILDEPTNDLDRDGRDAVLEFIRGHEHGLLLISHDRECLELCEDLWELSNLGLNRFGGGWHAYLEAKDKERQRLSDALDLAKRERDAAIAHAIEQRARLEKRNRRASKAAAKGGIPKLILGGRKRQAQVTTGKRDVALLDRTESAVRAAHQAFSGLKLDPVMYAELVGRELPSQKLIAEAHDFNIRFRDWIFEKDLQFSWRGNVRIALQGPNGSGKSTLLKALMGSNFDTRGELRRGSLVTLYLDQRCSVLDHDASVLDNVRSVSSDPEGSLRNGLARFLFAKDCVFQKVRDLSGGERVRAALARGLLSTEKPELILLDEPTNNLDLANIEFLQGVLQEFAGALIVVSHDRRFLENCRITAELALG